jgi:hypothetical protein
MKQYIPVLMLIVGLAISTMMIPMNLNESNKDFIDNDNNFDDDGRTWHVEHTVALGNLDESYSTGNSSILAVWVVNHSDIAETQYDTNDTKGTTNVNDSNSVAGYAQGSSFDIEVDHSTSYDLLIYCRINSTNGADGTMFNDTWVRVNFTTGSGFGCSGGVNLSGIVTHNTSGDPAMYMMFVYNGTDTGIVPYAGLQGDNHAMCGTGWTISRDNRSYITSIQLQCYY